MVVKMWEGNTGSAAFISSSLGFKTIGQPPLRLIWMTESPPVTVEMVFGTGEGRPGGRKAD